MPRVVNIKQDPFTLNDSDLEYLDFNNEINSIQEEIAELFTSKTMQVMQESDLNDRIDKTISILQDAEDKLENEYKVKVLQQQAEQLQLEVRKKRTSDEELKVTQDIANQIEQQLDEARNTIIHNHTNAQVKLALMEGYATINLLRSYFYGEIEYKIMTVGQDSKGNDIILEAHPNLAELYSNTIVTKGGGSSKKITKNTISLAITESATQFKKLLKKVDDGDREIKMANSILNQMAKVDLTPKQKNVWKVFQDVQKELSNIKSATLNYGNIGESFVGYMLEDTEVTVDNIYKLLEAGRNNLAYYLGADVENYQVKVLSGYHTKGRADIATLSNVITPLKEIKSLIQTGENPTAIKESIKQFFTPAANEGDRPFKEGVQESIRNVIAETLKKYGFNTT